MNSSQIIDNLKVNENQSKSHKRSFDQSFNSESSVQNQSFDSELSVQNNTDHIYPLVVAMSPDKSFTEIERQLANTKAVNPINTLCFVKLLKSNKQPPNKIFCNANGENRLDPSKILSGQFSYVIIHDPITNELRMVFKSDGHAYLALDENSVIEVLNHHALQNKTTAVIQFLKNIITLSIQSSFINNPAIQKQQFKEIIEFLSHDEIVKIAAETQGILQALESNPPNASAIKILQCYLMNAVPNLFKFISYNKADFDQIPFNYFKSKKVIAAGEIYFDATGKVIEVNPVSGSYTPLHTTPETSQYFNQQYKDAVSYFNFIPATTIVDYAEAKKIDSKIDSELARLHAPGTNSCLEMGLQRLEIRKKFVSEIIAQRNSEENLPHAKFLKS